MLYQSKVYACAFIALFSGPTEANIIHIVMMLSDHPKFCAAELPDEPRAILAEFAENLLFDHVQEQTNFAINDALIGKHYKRKLEKVIRTYCKNMEFWVTDVQVENLVTFFDTYFDLV